MKTIRQTDIKILIEMEGNNMTKIAFLFPGQGSQKPGMVKELFDALETAEQEQFEAAFPGIVKAIHSEEKIDTDAMAAQLVYVSGLLSAKACVEAGLVPDQLAGFSLGEITALSFSGVYSLSDSNRILWARTEAMDEACKETDGAMAAVNGLAVDQIESVLEDYKNVHAVNYNSPLQTVISGLRSELLEATAKLKAQGGKVIVLNVKGAFHTPYMASAGEALKQVLADLPIATFQYPVLSDIDAREYPGTKQEIKARIIQQVVSPVRFTDMIENLYDSGVRIFIETGYGRTLQGLVQRILPQAEILIGGVSDQASLEEMIKKIKEKSHV